MFFFDMFCGYISYIYNKNIIHKKLHDFRIIFYYTIYFPIKRSENSLKIKPKNIDSFSIDQVLKLVRDRKKLSKKKPKNLKTERSFYYGKDSKGNTGRNDSNKEEL